MPTEFSLRPGEEDEGEELAQVFLAARASAPMPASVHTAAATASWLSGRLRADEVWVAEVHRRVGGYVRLTDTWLDDLYVAPTYAGAGIGSALLDLAKARRPGGFCLWVFETNTPAREFYRRRGLVELERTDGSANEEREPDVRMAWPGAQPSTFFAALLAQVDADLVDLHARRTALARVLESHRPG